MATVSQQRKGSCHCLPEEGRILLLSPRGEKDPATVSQGREGSCYCIHNMFEAPMFDYLSTNCLKHPCCDYLFCKHFALSVLFVYHQNKSMCGMCATLNKICSTEAVQLANGTLLVGWQKGHIGHIGKIGQIENIGKIGKIWQIWQIG